jgi:hypothetical protein
VLGQAQQILAGPHDLSFHYVAGRIDKPEDCICQYSLSRPGLSDQPVNFTLIHHQTCLVYGTEYRSMRKSKINAQIANLKQRTISSSRCHLIPSKTASMNRNYYRI